MFFHALLSKVLKGFENKENQKLVNFAAKISEPVLSATNVFPKHGFYHLR